MKSFVECWNTNIANLSNKNDFNFLHSLVAFWPLNWFQQCKFIIFYHVLIKRNRIQSEKKTKPISSRNLSCILWRQSTQCRIRAFKGWENLANSMARIFIKMPEQENLIPYKLESGALEIWFFRHGGSKATIIYHFWGSTI